MGRLGSLSVFLCLFFCYGRIKKAETKNVLLLLGDEAGLDMGAYNNTAIETPHLDALAAKSLLFTHAYTSDPSSSSGRSVVLSGLTQHQNGMYGLSNGVHHFSSFDSTQSLPNILKGHNIRTGIIGKKNVKPDTVYKFDFEATEQQYDLENIGRNITLIKNLVRKFVANDTTRPFFLFVSLHDPSRCNNTDKYGQFCEKLGNGQPGMGTIPDWKAVGYSPYNMTVPYYLPDTWTTRQELANMYTAYSRLDQGVGVVMGELQKAGVLNDTLIIYTSVSSVPFVHSKNNLYQSGMAVPLLLSSPQHQDHWGQSTSALSSTVDLLPTILDWFGVTYPSPTPKLTGKSLLPLTANPADVTAYNRAFSSHNLDEVTMYYPMRVIRTPQYRLIHNLNYRSAFPMSPDIATSPTYLDVLNNTYSDLPTFWFKSLAQYFFREQWELFDTNYDQFEIENDATDPAHLAILQSLRKELQDWLELTQDPWRCLPAGVLLPSNTCFSVDNSEP